ncbi:MAG TPA: toll/interleukin-1 receptor domain-containing protein, partial [Sulfurospirillum arcachonense]|nr:toll/interleukin-1 receptor domain-containing protein [Sulfurospirillum arcachonense]
MRQKQYDIFISYSSKDSHIAFMLCEALENKGLICWIAPRDVEAGHYADSIVEGVESSKLFVLLFSQNSNDSRPVLNELEMAMASKLLIIPARIEEVLPSKAMKFYLMATHWFDIFEPKSVKDFHKFVSMVKGNLGESKKVSIENVEPQKMEIIWLEAEAEKKKNILSFKNILISISVLIVILALSYILIEEKTQNAVISPVKLKALIDFNKSIKNKDLTKKLIKETKEKEHWKEEYFKLREKYKKYSTLIVQAEEIKKTKGYEEAVNFYMNIKESNYRAAVNQYILPKNIENAIDYDYTGNASIIESNTNP